MKIDRPSEQEDSRPSHETFGDTLRETKRQSKPTQRKPAHRHAVPAHPGKPAATSPREAGANAHRASPGESRGAHPHAPGQPGSVAGHGVDRPLSAHRIALASDRAQAMKTARSAQNAYVDRLADARASGLATQRDRLSERAQALISRELERDPRKDDARKAPLPPTGVPPVQNGVPQPARDAPKVSRAEAARALVERIEVFLKSARPSLTLTLRGAFSGEAQIERVGPREVSVKLKAKPGAPRSLEVEALRQAMTERGLTLKDVSFG